MTAITASPVLGDVNNDKRDTLSFKLQVGLLALEEYVRKKRKKFSWRSLVAVMAETGSATLQQQ